MNSAESIHRLDSRARQRGLSLIELMISITIGLMILTGLTTIFVNSSNANREQMKGAQQIENGRFAIESLRQDLQLAGFYGQFSALPGTPAAVPDPCNIANEVAHYDALPLGIQLVDGTATRPSCIAAADHLAGTDILVVRRASTQSVSTGSATVTGDIYIQANPASAGVQVGNGSALSNTTTAAGASAVILRKDGITAAPIRKYHVLIYYVAPCSAPSGGGAVCTGATDDGGRPIPTLKRLELGANGGASAFNVVAMVGGIQNLQVEVGIDDAPVVPPVAGCITPSGGSCPSTVGDGVPDRYLVCLPAAPCTAADFASAVSAKVYVLARNTEPSAGYIDAKSYVLGSLTAAVGPYGDAYRRHVYGTEVRLVNMAGRRER